MQQTSKLSNKDIPMEVLTDILSRLAVKSLMRMRSMSKWVCRLIDSKEFMNQHLCQSLSSKTNRTLVLGGLGVYSIDLESLDKALVLKPPHRCSDISNSCNGLFLVLGESPYLWNPYTRFHKDIPPIPLDDSPSPPSSFTVLGFGFDALSDDYKVLNVLHFRGLDFRWLSSSAYVYSLRSNAWRKIRDFPYQLHCKRVWRVYLSGALHTIVFNHYSGLDPGIMAFDFASEEHRKLPLPHIPVKDFNPVGLDVLDGYLCVLNSLKKHRIDVWIMKEYGNKESWVKLLSIAPPAIERYSTLSPLVFSKEGDKVLLNCDDKWLVWYDLINKTSTNVPVEGLPFIFNAEVSVQSLLPFDDASVADKVRIQCSKQDKRRFRKKRDEFLSEGFKLVL
ncbi:hypothetical protein LIER_32469 [Lithospermum erythrorhizon]|uniref:F-box domain-containing protein n=1 Tax=Lithospermum erythrorhizon TaxID=34254 RepID=A0AAV3RTX8_LITER